ncbi:MAG TPA: CBS domain-containing protein [Streptosporangiaceae bacterium]|nr:CBS domain-containing protein [Streptosporangiaceae bacterium]
MSRNDAHLDAMLRHLGAAYYDSLHGRAAQADVARALDSVADQLGEEFPKHPAAAGRHDPASKHHQHHGRWHSRVRDVMTTSVVTVDRITPYKEIAGLLAKHRISGVPVLTMGRHVAGVVSEGDLLAARVQNAGGRWRWLTGRKEHRALVASQLMTSPAITIHPDASLATAAGLMSTHHLRRLPVVDPDGKLLGIVSRRDLLSVFLRPDAEIGHQVREILTEVLPGAPSGVEVAVHNGVVTLAGEPKLAADSDLVQVVVRLTRDVDGVVDVIDKTGQATASASR